MPKDPSSLLPPKKPPLARPSVRLLVLMLLCPSPSLSALSAVPFVTKAAEDASEHDWGETVTSAVMKFCGSDAAAQQGTGIISLEQFIDTPAPPLR